MVRRRGRLVWALAGLLALVGCAPSEGEEVPTAPVSQTPQSTEPVSDGSTDDGAEDPSDEPSERPEVDPPERPAAMEQETVDGAIAAAKYFVHLYPYVYASGDLSEWERLSDEGCGFCANVRERAEELHGEGGFSTGGAVDILSADGGGPYEDEVYTVELGIEIDSSEFVYPDGTRTPYAAIEDPTFVLSMRWKDTAWQVLGVLAGDES